MGSKIFRNYLPELFALGFIRIKPGMVTVNLTNRCNQKCIYCEIGQSIPSSREDRLSRDDLYWIIDQMSVLKIRKISLCGGEPFLFDGLLDVISYAGKRSIRCSVTSNGMTAHKLGVDALNMLRECKTEINLSIDSFDEEMNTLTRGVPSALANSVKSAGRLMEHGIPVTVLTVISKYNYKALSEFLQTAYRYGIKQVLFQPVIYYSNYPEQRALENKSSLNVERENIPMLMVQLKKILEFERKHDIRTNVYRIYTWIMAYLETASGNGRKWFFEDVLKKFYCREVYAIIDISYDGGIQPCGLAVARVSIMGDREPGLKNLWLQATAGLRSDVQQNRFYDFCNGCCHHFSRNMLASVLKYPLKNKRALITLFPLIVSRVIWNVYKKIFIHKLAG